MKSGTENQNLIGCLSVFRNKHIVACELCRRTMNMCHLWAHPRGAVYIKQIITPPRPKAENIENM